MELPNYIDLLTKLSYLEGILRVVEADNDPLPMEYLLRDPEMEELVCRHFHCESGQSFLQDFMNRESFKSVLDQRFAGERLLFHTRKCRGEHTLPNTHMLYCIRGSCVLRIRGEELVMGEGDTCIITAGTPHAYYNTKETTLVLHAALTAAFVGNVLLPRLPQDHLQADFFRSIVFDENPAATYVYIPAGKTAEMTYFISSAFYHHLFRPPMHEEIVNSNLMLFFSFLLQSLQMQPETAAALSPEKTLQQILSHISENCRGITLSKLAETFHFNESYLSQYLKKSTGKTFTQLLQDARVSLAAKLLINTNLSVVDIADRVGYQNMSYFYKLFAQVNQCSPAEYRSRFLRSSKRVIGHEGI